MSYMDTPAENTGGGNATSEQSQLDALPAKVRVHALAKLLGTSSRELLAMLGELGEVVRSPQSSVTRELAQRVGQRFRDTRAENAAPREAAPADEQDLAGSEQPRRVRLPVFAAPSAVFQPPEGAAEPAVSTEDATSAVEEDDSAAGHADGSAAEGGDDDEDAGDTHGEGRRRRRRGRRGRGRGKGGHGGDDDTTSSQAQDAQTGAGGTDTGEPTATSDSADGGEPARARTAKDDTASATDGDDAASDGEQGDDQGEDQGDDQGEAGSRRRRRRRRRKDTSGAGNGTDGDPPNTVVHVRDSRPEAADAPSDEVRSVRGSTRLEAKRQRRRDGREAGRRKAPILSEAEFLARRESVRRTMVVRERDDHVQIGVQEDGMLVEHFVTSQGSGSLVGNVYLGRVQNVLPSMEAAFVDIGRGRNAVLYAGEVDWDSAGLEGKARKIEQALATGDSVLVQATKDPVGHKGARLTTQISLPGRFLVYVPAGGATGISRKLPDTERKRLKEILKRAVPSGAGVIVRTASEGVSEDALSGDVSRLRAQWEVIQSSAEAKRGKAPVLLYEEPNLLVKVVRDMFTEDFSELVVSGDSSWQTIEGYVRDVAPELSDRLRRHVDKVDVFTAYRIDEQITKALDRKVWLPSGGYLVIDRTEAMTVIDVNTGKFTGSGGNLEETVTRNNLESAEEIVRQLRLRDIGGIIVIDFIDMVLESNRDLVLRRLTECLGRDRTRHQVAEVTSLGLVQMTRKRVGTGLLEAFSTPCEHCKGRGVVVTTEPVTPSGTQGGSGRKGKSRGRSGEQDASAKGGPERDSGKAAEHIALIHAKAEQVSQQPAQESQEPATTESGTTAGGQAGRPPGAAETNGSVPEAPAGPLESQASPSPAVASETPGGGTHGGGTNGEQQRGQEPSTGRRRRRAASRPAGPPSSVAHVADPGLTPSEGGP